LLLLLLLAALSVEMPPHPGRAVVINLLVGPRWLPVGRVGRLSLVIQRTVYDPALRLSLFILRYSIFVSG